MHTIIWILSGLLAGVLARMVTRSRGRGIVADTALGALGSVAGAWLLLAVFGQKPANSLSHIATAVGGAVALVGLARVARMLIRQAEHLAGAAATGMFPGESQIERLSALERQVVERVLGRVRPPRDAEAAFRAQLPFGARVADKVARFGGSWTFLGFFFAFMLGWMFLNVTTDRPVDPYPFILLNLVLSCLAAVQAPVIMMSQNRQSERDRFDARQDYEVNLRAELQIAEIHQKLDQARASELQTLIELGKKQVALLEELVERR
jgi:uncharacterized membrane protein/uncharacterized membrane protein YeaQ/YmgE (transglycosylase-associated protein family)